MKDKFLVPVLAVTLLTVGASIACAQPAESTLQLVTELHISPASAAAFEELSKARQARMAEGNVTFATRVSVSEGLPLVYRSTSYDLENMAALDMRQAQLDAMPPSADPGAARGVIDHIESSIRRTRPDLNYAPDDPRVPIAEASFLREIDIYLQFGVGAEAEEIVEQLAALYERHNIRNILFVTSRVTGSGPDLRFVTLARDAADFYSENQRVAELLGDELQSLIMQRGALSRRVDFANRTIRRDLKYQPSN